MIPLGNAAMIARGSALSGRLVLGNPFQDTPNFCLGGDRNIGDEVVLPQERVAAIGRGNPLVDDGANGCLHGNQEHEDDMVVVNADLLQDRVVSSTCRAPCRLQPALLPIIQRAGVKPVPRRPRRGPHDSRRGGVYLLPVRRGRRA